MSKGGNNKLLLALLFLGGMATYLFKSKKKDTFSGIIPYDDFNKDDVSNLLRDYDIPDLEEGADMPNLTYGSPNPPKSEGDIEGQVLSINIANNTSSDMSLISILGNNQDTMDNNNATTQYGWNLTGFSITNEDTITLQYKGVTDGTFTTTSIPLNGTTLQSVANALNLLNLGTFFIATSGGNTYLYNYNQNIVFGTLQITSSTSSGGQVNTTFNVGIGFNNDGYVVEIQSDGKLLVGGTFISYQGVTKNRIIRLNTDGSIDASFVIGTGFSINYVNSIAIQTDGKILVGGNFISYNGTTANNIIRLNTNGSVDGTFVYGIGFNDVIYSIAIQTDGKILVGGNFTSYNGTSANRIIRLNTNGSVDGTFVYGSGFDFIPEDIKIQTDGKIVIVGLFTSYNGTIANGIIRLNSSGSVDTSFVYGSGFDNLANVVYTTYIQTDGKILVGGNFTTYDGTSANGIIRLNTNGSVDTSFVYGSGFANYVTSIQVQSDGKILCGGSFTSYNGTSANNIIRLNSNGGVDTSFVYGSGFNSSVISMSISISKIYLVGAFTTYNGTTYNRIVSLNQ